MAQRGGISHLHVELSNVTKVYEDPPETVTALKDISFNVNEGEFLCIVGPSGCGKSTLLRMIAGLDRPSSGQIRFRGDLLTAPHSKISMVFQTFDLPPGHSQPSRGNRTRRQNTRIVREARESQEHSWNRLG